jgi:hypothetical protein
MPELMMCLAKFSFCLFVQERKEIISGKRHRSFQAKGAI